MRPFEWWVTQYHQIMLSLSKSGLSEYAEKHVFGSLNLNNSELFMISFKDIFLGILDTYTKKMNLPRQFWGGGRVVHGKVCWLIAYNHLSYIMLWNGKNKWQNNEMRKFFDSLGQLLKCTYSRYEPTIYIDGHESKPANSNFSKKFLFDKFEGNTFLHNVLKNLVPSMSLYPSFRQLSKPQWHFSTKQNRLGTLILLRQR